MSDYFSVLTNTGAAIETAAKDNGDPVTFSHIVVGSVDQPGTVAQLKQKTALGQEVARVAVSKVSTHPSYPDQLIIDGVIPPGMGGWYVREAGVISDSKLYSIARYPETYKSNSLGVPTEMYIRLVVKTSGDPNITYVGGSPNPMIPQASVVETVRQTRGTETEAGSLEIANEAETKGGSDKTRAIVPYYLKLWWDSVRTWSNIKNIPATASRWPSWSEVTSKPSTFTPSSHTHSGSQVAAGTETARGTLEIANDAETKGGLDKTRAIVPYYLKLWWDQVRVWDNIKNKPRYLIDSGQANGGHWELYSDGTIEQWASFSFHNALKVTVKLPISFTSGPTIVIPADKSSSTDASPIAWKHTDDSKAKLTFLTNSSSTGYAQYWCRGK